MICNAHYKNALKSFYCEICRKNVIPPKRKFGSKFLTIFVGNFVK